MSLDSANTHINNGALGDTRENMVTIPGVPFYLTLSTRFLLHPGRIGVADSFSGLNRGK